MTSIPSPLDLEALEAFMVSATSEKPNMADLETAGLAWLKEIRRLRALRSSPPGYLHVPGCGYERGEQCACHLHPLQPGEAGEVAPKVDPSLLEWAHTRTIRFDHTVHFGLGWDSFGIEHLSQEAHIPGASYLIWPEKNKWSLYDTSDGGLCYCSFASEEEAKAKAEEWANSFLRSKVEGEPLRETLRGPSAGEVVEAAVNYVRAERAFHASQRQPLKKALAESVGRQEDLDAAWDALWEAVDALEASKTPRSEARGPTPSPSEYIIPAGALDADALKEFQNHRSEIKLVHRGPGEVAEGVRANLETLIPNLLELARGEDHDNEGCPEDDTCGCPNIAALNAEFRAIAVALASSPHAPADVESLVELMSESNAKPRAHWKALAEKFLESHTLPHAAGSKDQGAPATNRYGVDAAYFRTELSRLADSLNDRPAGELARYLRTLADAAEPAKAQGVAPAGPGLLRDALAALNGMLVHFHDGIVPDLCRGLPGKFDLCTFAIGRAREVARAIEAATPSKGVEGGAA